jgi:hypothetical protein
MSLQTVAALQRSLAFAETSPAVAIRLIEVHLTRHSEGERASPSCVTG